MAINALMQFILDGGTAIPGESQSVVDESDSLANAGATWTEGYYFEVEDFEFSLEIDESSGVDGGGGAGGGADGYAKLKAEIDDLRAEVRRNAGAGFGPKQGGGKDDAKGGKTGGRGGRFDEYVTGNQDPAGYKPRVAPFSFKKQIDLGSTALINNCFKPTAFQSAILIKRKDTGGNANGGTATGNSTYLRFDFLEPLITQVELTVDETVRQSVKFVCRQVTITYASQQSTGSTKVQTKAAVLKLNA